MHYILAKEASQVVLLTYTLLNQHQKAKLDFVVKKNQSLKIIILCVFKNSSLQLITTQNHTQILGSSNLICKSVLDKHSEFVYQGKVIVAKQAQKTNAYQRNENLLLDGNSKVTSQPNLEILANDVFCTHGSFTSFLNPLEVYYLKTRGLTKKQAEKLLIKGFIMSALSNLMIDPGICADSFSSLEKRVAKLLLF